MKTLVIYHGNCRDGFCAAWVARRAIPDAEFHEGFYGQPPPDVTGRVVYILDFSYPRDVMIQIAEKAARVTVLDHHQTAQAALEGLKGLGLPLSIEFDMNRSGAGMAWDYFSAPEPYEDPPPRPWLVDYIEDRDLWRFALPNSKEINAYLSIVPMTFEAFSLATQLDLGYAREMGEAVSMKTAQYVREVSKNVRRINFEGYNVPCVNAPQVDISELLGDLCHREFDSEGEEAPFALGWFHRADGVFQFSLRSRGAFDVSEIAKKYGGGGHKNAAGFQLSYLPSAVFGASVST